MDQILPEMHYYGSVLKSHYVSGFLLTEAVYSSGVKIPKHSHAEANICIALKGTCSEAYGRKSREYKALTWDFLPPNHSHSLSLHGAGIHCFSLEIAPSWLERAREHSLMLDTSLHCEGGLLAGLLMRLYDEFQQMDNASPLSIEGLALEMLAEVSRRYAGASERRPPRWLNNAREILHAQFSAQIGLASLAESVGVHPVHLAREFRKHFHCTVGEYVCHLRVRYACHELYKFELSLADIAVMAGYSDQSHFSRAFKRIMHMTPAKYRATFSSR
jgi:AraC family transcriptional regulator